MSRAESGFPVSRVTAASLLTGETCSPAKWIFGTTSAGLNAAWDTFTPAVCSDIDFELLTDVEACCAPEWFVNGGKTSSRFGDTRGVWMDSGGADGVSAISCITAYVVELCNDCTYLLGEGCVIVGWRNLRVGRVGATISALILLADAAGHVSLLGGRKEAAGVGGGTEG